MKKLFLILSAIALISTSALCQFENQKKTYHWLDAGLGIYGAGFKDEPPIGLTLNVNYSVYRNLLFKLMYTYGEEVMILDPRETFHEIGLLVGDGISKKYYQAMFSGGIGGISFYRPKHIGTESFLTGIYEWRRYTVPSLLLDADFLFKASKHFGIGVTIHSNLNANEPILVASLKLAVGRLR